MSDFTTTPCSKLLPTSSSPVCFFPSCPYLKTASPLSSHAHIPKTFRLLPLALYSCDSPQGHSQVPKSLIGWPSSPDLFAPDILVPYLPLHYSRGLGTPVDTAQSLFWVLSAFHLLIQTSENLLFSLPLLPFSSLSWPFFIFSLVSTSSLST